MKTILTCAALSLALAGAAEAQPRGGRSATLFAGPNFTGPSVTVSTDVPNLSNYGFNDRAHSLRLNGLWRLCEHSDYGGRCVELSGDVPALNVMGLGERISSLQPVGGYGGRGPDRDPERGAGRGPGGPLVFRWAGPGGRAARQGIFQARLEWRGGSAARRLAL